MSTRKLVLSTVGISILLNSLTKSESEWRKKLNQESNLKELSEDVRLKAEELAQQALGNLRNCDIDKNRSLSAELNGLYALYQNQLSAVNEDMHYLIATDTALGRIAAETIDTFLKGQGLLSNVYYPPELSTAEPEDFSKGIKDLIRWCEVNIPGYRKSGYEVIFNLTGAFKSLQGYLNIVGMFYADEIVYIFERGNKLISIPRLPLQIDIEVLREYSVELALMSQGYTYELEQINSMPTGLLDIGTIEGNKFASLSGWGMLIWNRSRQELLDDDLLDFPRVQYTEGFCKKFKQLPTIEKVKLQETLAKVSGLLKEFEGNINVLRRDGALQYDNYTGKKTSEGCPIGHFRVSNSRRVSCIVRDGVLLLRRYGEHSINDNP